MYWDITNALGGTTSIESFDCEQVSLLQPSRTFAIVCVFRNVSKSWDNIAPSSNGIARLLSITGMRTINFVE